MIVTETYAKDSSTFAADKESLWKHPQEHDGWTIAHDSIRGELNNFKDALASVSDRHGKSGSKVLLSWELDAARSWWESHVAHFKAHHGNEDHKFNPYLRTRFNYPEKLEKEHETIEEHTDRIDALLKKDEVVIKDLKQLWKEYIDMLLPHLKEEEDVGIPLMRAFFTPEEIGALVASIVGDKMAPKEEMGSFIYFLGEKLFRERFMPQEGIPFFVWWLDFAPKLEYYKSKVQAQIEGLKSGVPPKAYVPQSSSKPLLFAVAAVAGILAMYVKQSS